MPTVVKRVDRKEDFDAKKLYASIFVVCTKTDRSKQECENVSETVTDTVQKQIEEREEVLSTEVRMWVRDELQKVDEKLADKYYKGFHDT